MHRRTRIRDYKKMAFKIHRRRDDVLFSIYLRKKRNYTCERCLRYFPEGKGLDVSHFYGRRAESVRFSESNVDVLCRGCHRYFGENPAEYYEWKLKNLGQAAFDHLTIQAHRPSKKDIESNIALIKLKMNELEPHAV
jgi:5-methylcytosine-specific restriction endonuclease McrA